MCYQSQPTGLLFGLILLGTLLLVLIIIVCVVRYAACKKARERQARAAARAVEAQRRKEERSKKIESYLIVKEWSNPITCNEEKHQSKHDDQVCETGTYPIDPPCSTADLDIESAGIKRRLSSNSANRQQQGECAICLGAFDDGDLLGQSYNSRCQHQFHCDCIRGWLMVRDECPCCRRSFLTRTIDSSKLQEIPT